MLRSRQLSSTAYPLNFLMVLSIDHNSPATGKTVTVTLSKNGGGFNPASGAVTEIANGWYSLAGHATDRNTLGELLIHATATGCDPVDFVTNVVGADPFDAVRLGLTALPNVAAGANGGLPLGDASGRVTVGDIVAAALAKFFTTDSGSTYAASVAGSVVREIASNAATSVATIAGAVWNAVASSYIVAGSMGYLENLISSRATAGANVTLSSSIAENLDINIQQGDAIIAGSPNQIQWIDDANVWSALVINTVTLYLSTQPGYANETSFPATYDALNATITLDDLLSADTSNLKLTTYTYRLRAAITPASDGPVTLVTGKFTVARAA